MTCAPSKDSDQPGHSPSLISLRCALIGKPRTQCFFVRTAKTDQTGRMPRLIWVFSDRTGHFVGFVMRFLKCNTWTLKEFCCIFHDLAMSASHMSRICCVFHDLAVSATWAALSPGDAFKILQGHYSDSIGSEDIFSFLLCTMIYLSYVNLTIQLSQFDEYPTKIHLYRSLKLFIGHK